MDPLTILALAKGSYEAIKAGISVGKEMQGMFSDVMSLLDSANQLTKIATKPPKPKLTHSLLSLKTILLGNMV